MDKYQGRYLAHQKRKREIIRRIIRERQSSRFFKRELLNPKDVAFVVWSMERAASSCDRHPMRFDIVTSRAGKEALSGLLVGALGWAYTAGAIIIIRTDPTAYKENLAYMPYLDAGVAVGQAYLAATSIGLGICYINPHVHRENDEAFSGLFNRERLIFCGALAIGKKEPLTTP